MVLVSLAICSAQPVGAHTIKAKEAHHHNLKAHSNIHTKGFGGGGGFGFGGGGGSGGGGFGIGVGGGRGSDGSNTPNSGCNQPGCSDPGYNVPGYGSPIYIPGFGVPVYSPGCGYVCPANNPSGEITELKISGLSHSTGPYRCRPGPNMHVNKDYTYELLLNFVSTMQDKHKNKHEHLRHGEAGGGVGLSIGGSRHFGIGRDGGRGTGGLVPLSTISRTLVAVSMDMVTLAMDPTLIMAVHLDEVMHVLATILVDESLNTISQDIITSRWTLQM
ncbi:hypothetical protein K7X08_018121 [Anisodus acutangulus]|uniref:Uncharacterized protein n=1 Tax=Anisodus acutangulus TaxID=402998 RepID=A0A9Q1LZS7_9SOLA|nr:hypothetical protein K7X08_018121 [Anisodus acutangulus]